MIVDDNLKFAIEQALTASADAPDAVDLKDIRDIGNSPDIHVVFSVKETFDSAGDTATLTLTLTTDDNEDLSSDTDIQTLASLIPQADLVAGYLRVFKIQSNDDFEQFLGLRCTVGTENFTAGKYNAFVTTQPEKWKAYANAI